MDYFLNILNNIFFEFYMTSGFKIYRVYTKFSIIINFLKKTHFQHLFNFSSVCYATSLKNVYPTNIAELSEQLTNANALNSAFTNLEMHTYAVC